MTDPIKPEKSPDGPGNHPRTSTHGGASAFPTPANNAGGGRGWGDKGFWKGGTDGGQQGAGHENAPNPRATIGGFLGLSSQKSMAGERNEERYIPHDKQTGEPTCNTEDHSFMEHRPGRPGTLPGWEKMKNAADMVRNQGR